MVEFLAVRIFFKNRPWWPSSISRSSNSSRVVAAEDPGSNLGHAYCTVMDCDLTPIAEPALELYSRAAPSVEAHHCFNGPLHRKKFWRKADNII